METISLGGDRHGGLECTQIVRLNAGSLFWQVNMKVTHWRSEIGKMGSITIAPLASVEAVQRRQTISHAISILGPKDGVKFPIIQAPHVLQLSFDDVGYTSAFGTAATTEDISDLIEFARMWAGKGNLLVHCKAGTSRSPAAAMIALASLDALDLDKCLSDLLALRNYYRPNTTMLRIAEGVLNRKDALVTLARNRIQDCSPQTVLAATFESATD